MLVNILRTNLILGLGVLVELCQLGRGDLLPQCPVHLCTVDNSRFIRNCNIINRIGPVSNWPDIRPLSSSEYRISGPSLIIIPKTKIEEIERCQIFLLKQPIVLITVWYFHKVPVHLYCRTGVKTISKNLDMTHSSIYYYFLSLYMFLCVLYAITVWKM